MTFARLAKLLALVVVAFALWEARPPAAPSHVAILALPGASADLLGAMDATVSAPGEPDQPGASFWQRVFAATEAHGAVDPAGQPPLWSGSAAPLRTLSVPGRLFADEVADAGTFAGGSSGAIVETADITSGRIPAPYDRAVDTIASSIETLRIGQWSDWIHVEPASGVAGAPAPPPAEFQFVRVSDSSCFFSPAYVIAKKDIVGTPFLRGADRDLRPLLAAHLVALSKKRGSAEATLFVPGADVRPVAVFDGLAEEVTAVFEPDSTPAAMLDEVRTTLQSELRGLRDAVGPDGVVIVIGGPGSGRARGEAAWLRIYDGSKSPTAVAQSMVDLEAARAAVRYGAGVALGPAEKSLLPVALTSRFPVRATLAKAKQPSAPQTVEKAWSPASLESIPGAVGSGS